MNTSAIIGHIVEWLENYSQNSGTRGFVVGVSGGIDSALCSTLAAMTAKRVICLMLPIHQQAEQVERARRHIEWLGKKFPNVESLEIDLTETSDVFLKSFPRTGNPQTDLLATANSRSRLRMVALYHVAGLYNLLVVGTGNKIEDFGIGFFTKYGDGGVDISPIADLTKTQVYALCRELEVIEEILSAEPTDGLFGDSRTDRDQIGASYPELEWAMQMKEKGYKAEQFEGREREIFEIYDRRNRANRHKMDPVPICRIPPELFL